MRRRDFLAATGGGFLLAMRPPVMQALAPMVAAPARGLLIAVDARVGAGVKTAVAALMEAAPTHPLLVVMAGAGKAKQIDSKMSLSSKDLAYNHVVVIGRPDDPLVQAMWQREAQFDAKGAYVFGFGGFSGDVGYVEADRNPLLHAVAIPTAPFETEVVVITGTTDEGIALALRSFTERGLVNGLVAGDGWKRTETTLLDRDPLKPKFALPELAPEKIGAFQRVALSQGAEDEYRGVLEDTGVEPVGIWRFKYYRPGVWDGKGAVAAFDNYSYGLHRRAYGNTLWMAQFESAAAAAGAAPKIAETAHLKKEGDEWTGEQPPYGFGPGQGKPQGSGPLKLWQKGEWLLMSTLDEKKEFAA